jgi:hypothetical protein
MFSHAYIHHYVTVSKLKKVCFLLRGFHIRKEPGREKSN